MRTRAAPPAPPARPERKPNRARTKWVAAIVISAAALAGGWYYGQGPAADLRAAEKALSRNDPTSARGPLDRRLRFWPDDQKTLLLAARAARRTDAYADAERFLTRYETAHGSTEEFRFEWALLGVQQGDPSGDVGRVLGGVNTKHPDYPLLLEALAKGARAEFRFSQSMTVLRQLLDKSPDHGPGLLLRAQMKVELRRPEEAEVDYRKAVELLPHNVAARLSLAEYLIRNGNTREAESHFRWVLQFRSDDPAALFGLARTLFDQGDIPAARARLDELLVAHPEHVNGLTEAGRLAVRIARPADAVPYLERALAAAPWQRDAAKLLVMAWNDQNKPDPASKADERVAAHVAEDAREGILKLRAKDDPRDSAVRWELWLWSIRNGQEDEGLAWLFEILQIDPRHTGAHDALATYFDRVGQPRRSKLHRELVIRP